MRRTWELDPDQFQLTNPKWGELIEEIIANVQWELGLEERKLTAHLYKLLVYEKEGFFLPHRDGEKLDRMVATLVIVLPTVCTDAAFGGLQPLVKRLKRMSTAKRENNVGNACPSQRRSSIPGRRAAGRPGMRPTL